MDEQLLASVQQDTLTDLQAGFELWKTGSLEAARARLEQALERATLQKCSVGQLSALQLLGHLAFEQGDFAESRALHEVVLAECRGRRIGVGVASSLHNLGLLAAYGGDGATARRQISEAINLYRMIGRQEAAQRALASLRRIIAADEAS